jgi:hypothetical protein
MLFKSKHLNPNQPYLSIISSQKEVSKFPIHVLPEPLLPA